MIKKIDGKYYVFKTISYKPICFIFETLEQAQQKFDELTLNEAFFLMFGVDDRKSMDEYAKKNYQTENYGRTFEQYYNSLYSSAICSKREVIVESNNTVNFLGTDYYVLENNKQLKFKRNNTDFQYYEYDKIKKILKEIILFRAEKQGGLDFSNLQWNNELSSNLARILFEDLYSKYNDEQVNSLRKYTGADYGIFNDFIGGNLVKVDDLKKLVSDIFNIYTCSVETPYNLYLHRGAGSDAEFYRKEENGTDEFFYSQFISTSFNATAIEPFKRGEELFIKIPKGTRVIFKGMFDLMHGNGSIENEVLLLPSKFNCERELEGGYDKKFLLNYKESINVFELVMESLKKNSESYIQIYGKEKFDEVYNFAYELSIQIQQDEIDRSNSSQNEKINMLNRLKFFINRNRYYGVESEIENMDSDYIRNTL